MSRVIPSFNAICSQARCIAQPCLLRLRCSGPHEISRLGRNALPSQRGRWQSVAATAVEASVQRITPATLAAKVGACPGCGALAQTIEPSEAGHYSIKRTAVRSFLAAQTGNGEASPEANKAGEETQEQNRGPPLCDRCHDLTHHHSGVSIIHPSLESLHDTIAESPYKHNHIYHIIDAADFPLSLIPNIHKELEASLQRGINRRAKHAGYRYGRKTEISFIITRADLLAPKKEEVDRLMNYLIAVLRKALGPFAENVRLGNVRCVSARRGWWTKEIKQNIWDRGGGGWMVGKVNVGKSNLYEVVFPKGRGEKINIQGERSRARIAATMDPEIIPGELMDPDLSLKELTQGKGGYLLPPPRPETPYPTMPTISSLPGTTASPIRIPFGSGRGELIDLPGLARGDLETYISPEHRELLVMRARPLPEQLSLKVGRSLLLADVIRITPIRTFDGGGDDLVVLAYNFTPLQAHVTSTEKAVATQAGERSESSGLTCILNEKGRESIRSAGRFRLETDVTRKRSGPLTTRSGVGLQLKTLPFVVLSTDILIEGVGWVEVVAQVRRKRGEAGVIPEVEVFSPGGKGVGSRECMGAWGMNGGLERSEKGGKRPRRSMVSLKRARAPGSGGGSG